jgi:hypothetical protein
MRQRSIHPLPPNLTCHYFSTQSGQGSVPPSQLCMLETMCKKQTMYSAKFET